AVYRRLRVWFRCRTGHFHPKASRPRTDGAERLNNHQIYYLWRRTDPAMKALGIYGGSFDPIHLGHLLLAETAREELNLDQVIFVPAAQSPLKKHCPQISAADRLALIKLAIRENPGFTFSEVELKRKPPSYTVDTLRYF